MSTASVALIRSLLAASLPVPMQQSAGLHLYSFPTSLASSWTRATSPTEAQLKSARNEEYEADDGPLTDEQLEQLEEVAAWQRKEGKSESGGLNRKGIESYRRENPGSKLSMAVTTKPSKLKPGSKAANRRKSFCARMGGMKRRLTSAKTARDPDSRINKSLRKWNC